MPTFTVHEPPFKDESAPAPERFIFVRDGFHFWAFLLAPLWLLVHRLWFILFCYLVVTIGLAVGLKAMGAPSAVETVVMLLIALLMGFEAPSLWRWNLTRRKWKMLGFVVAEDAELAERRFFAEWAGQRAEPSSASPRDFVPPPPVYNTPVRRGPPSGSDVIGLFPEPGNSSGPSR